MAGMILNFIRGFCMSVADSVPGVSGGTIAFLLGFYDKFIESIDSLLTGSREEKKDGLKFLLKLGLGWIIGFLISVAILSNLFESHIYLISSLFLGLIVFAIPIIVISEKKCLEGRYANIIYTIAGILIVTAITYFNPVSNGDSDMDITHLTLGMSFYVFIAAVITISAMVLPGISGSTLLLAMGLYLPMITGIKALMDLDTSYLPAILVFAAGLIFGILLVVKVVKHCLNCYRSQTVYLIIGLLIGSIYSVVMGPTTLEVSQPAMSLSTFNIILFFLGGVILWLLEAVKKRMMADTN